MSEITSNCLIMIRFMFVASSPGAVLRPQGKRAGGELQPALGLTRPRVCGGTVRRGGARHARLQSLGGATRAASTRRVRRGLCVTHSAVGNVRQAGTPAVPPVLVGAAADRARCTPTLTPTMKRSRRLPRPWRLLTALLRSILTGCVRSPCRRPSLPGDGLASICACGRCGACGAIYTIRRRAPICFKGARWMRSGWPCCSAFLTAGGKAADWRHRQA